MENPKQVVPLDDVHSFATVVTQWYVNTLRTLHHTKKIPEGTEVYIGDDTPVVLEGKLLDGFRMGIEASIAGIGDLPFFSKGEGPAPNNEAQSETHLNEVL